jgi:hypothetical protein
MEQDTFIVVFSLGCLPSIPQIPCLSSFTTLDNLPLPLKKQGRTPWNKVPVQTGTLPPGNIPLKWSVKGYFHHCSWIFTSVSSNVRTPPLIHPSPLTVNLSISTTNNIKWGTHCSYCCRQWPPPTVFICPVWILRVFPREMCESFSFHCF